MVKQATFRQTLISLVKRKIYKQYEKKLDGKIQKGDAELLNNLVVELKDDFQIVVNEDDTCDIFYEKMVSYTSENRNEDYMTLLVKYNKLF